MHYGTSPSTPASAATAPPTPHHRFDTPTSLSRHANSLKCEDGLEGWQILKQERLELSGNDIQPENKGAHDDLAIATGLAAWAATIDFPEVEDESRIIRRRIDGGGPLF